MDMGCHSSTVKCDCVSIDHPKGFFKRYREAEADRVLGTDSEFRVLGGTLQELSFK